MIKRYSGLLIFTIFLFASSSLYSQNRYWVFLSDKTGVSFDPYSYFDPSAIQKRLDKHISLSQTTDLPLRADYLEEIQKITGNLGTSSRWFNAVSVRAGKNNIDKISKLPFVVGIQEIQMVSSTAEKPFNSDVSWEDDQLREAQINALGVKYFEDMGIDGTGVRIAIFDGGFPGVDTSPMFQHIRESGRIIATWDFVKNTEFVYDYSSHGTSVLTCIAGIIDDKKFGLAPGAEFLLARTEVTREVFSEEENWLAAVEWADKNGADIISSSLGYTFKRYFPKQMDGKSTLVTRSANLAASKGMLVINAAGNDGDKDWEVIGAPADADSVLSIGGVSPDNGYHINFSSYGPTFDGRMKPNLVAFGKVATSNDKKIKQSFGTSFSTPLVSGFAACVMQIHPEWDNMETFRQLEMSGHLYPYYDYAHGYGVPQASYFTLGKTEAIPTFAFEVSEEFLKIITVVDIKDDSDIWEDVDTSGFADLQPYYDSIYADSDAVDTSFFSEEELIEMQTAAEEAYLLAEEEAGNFDIPDSVLLNMTDGVEDVSEQTEWQEDTSWVENPEVVGDESWVSDSTWYSADESDYDSEPDWIEPSTTGYQLDSNFLYFHIIGEESQKIKRYALVNMQFADEYTISWDDLENGDTLVVYYKGYTNTYHY